MQLKQERCLCFKIYNDNKAKQLEEKLKTLGIDFVSYYDGLYVLFKVRRCGNKWVDIMAIVNSVSSAKYSFEKTCIVDGVEYDFCN